MPGKKRDVLRILNKIADMLEIKGENQFRVRAYRDAARTLEGYSRDLSSGVEEPGELTDLPGIGEDLAGKIKTIVKTGSLPLLEDLESEMPAQINKLLKIPGLGPRKVHDLYEELDVKSMEDLREVLDQHKIRELEGFGAKTEENIRVNMERLDTSSARIRIDRAQEAVRPLIEYLKEEKKVNAISLVGSLRRRKETIGDIDILAEVKKGSSIMKRFTNHEDVKEVAAAGEKKSTIVLSSGLRIDLRIFKRVSYGAAMVYFTGSKKHNVAIRGLAMDKGYKLNEYGLYKGKKRIAGTTEKSVYTKLGLHYIPPELREDRGEVELAKNKQNKLPDLVELDHIRGDLHTHTNAADGKNSIEEMIEAAIGRGYDYIGVTDHSRNLSVARGFNEKEVSKRIEEIKILNEKYSKIEVLSGLEVDILESGKLDLDDSVLEQLDVVIASVHDHFGLSRKEQTRRILKAMENPNVHILGHPTGRKINKRKPYKIDIEEIIKAANKNTVAMEINAQPVRLDLNDVNCKMAVENGVRVAVNSDSHSTLELDYMRYGVYQARRGWLEGSRILNTLSLSKLKKALRRG